LVNIFIGILQVFLVHGQVLVVIWFVIAVLIVFSLLGTAGASRIPTGFQNFMEAAVEFVTDIARDQLGESFYKEWIPFIGTLFFFILDVTGLVPLFRGN
jgi:F-type H+-transporting ATPase subunit a